jgi:hypothetical protein
LGLACDVLYVLGQFVVFLRHLLFDVFSKHGQLMLMRCSQVLDEIQLIFETRGLKLFNFSELVVHVFLLTTDLLLQVFSHLFNSLACLLE